MTNKKHIHCRKCSQALVTIGIGFVHREDFTCSITGCKKDPDGFCDEAKEGTPQSAGDRYDIDISHNAIVWGD